MGWRLKEALCMFIVVTTFFSFNDARFHVQSLHYNGPKLHRSSVRRMWEEPDQSKPYSSPLQPTNGDLMGQSSPISLPPYELLAPLPLPDNITPFCETPPFSPPPPSKAKTPPSPPPPPISFNGPPAYLPPIPKPPYAYEPVSPGGSPSAPSYGTNPPTHSPSPPKHVPSPPVHQSPPIHTPPSLVSPPPHKKPQYAVWCVAKPTVPDSELQEALDYACGSGADCKSIQPNGSCFQPDTLLAHASYAFNSYWQKAKIRGGTCDFGGTAMLVTVDPSFNRCEFIFN
ncbi:hypothetical protein K2173_009922 [Erythroxylum novogranatense]|uniref:X8 domain-containing protein n=1 Tax=Erythroxylum novogranatense TaxID=1862640 RepID=A0AAV8SZC5_9ROSI|nr:hypothetical protein K2173_009922 [Erythroxylum novogranatense]